MKRFNLLFLFSVLSCLFSFGQTIDFFEDNENFFVLSPNGRYSAGAIESFPAFFYDITEKKFSYCQPEFDRGYFTNAINNEGRVAGAVEHKAAIWEQGGDGLCYQFQEILLIVLNCGLLHTVYRMILKLL